MSRTTKTEQKRAGNGTYCWFDIKTSLNDGRAWRWQEQDLMFCERTPPRVNEDDSSSQLQGMGHAWTEEI